MSVADLEHLWSQLPEVFKKVRPPRLGDEWLVVPEDVLEDSDFVSSVSEFDALAPVAPQRSPQHPLHKYGRGGSHQQSGSYFPPPDAYAFYLPFHYFYPDYWGIYLLAEGVEEVAEMLHSESGGALTREKWVRAARNFLYWHEVFHHATECFATRLEVTHRKPIYKTGFERFYQVTAGTDDCAEEGLACAYAYANLKTYTAKADRPAVLATVRSWIQRMPPGYRQGQHWLKTRPYEEARSAFAEASHKESVNRKTLAEAIWRMFPKAFDPFARKNTPVSYLVHRDSPLAKRTGLNLRYFKKRDVEKKLSALGCAFERHAKGSHEVWVAPSGKRFSLINHPRELGWSYIQKIMRSAGLDVTAEQFHVL